MKRPRNSLASPWQGLIKRVGWPVSIHTGKLTWNPKMKVRFRWCSSQAFLQTKAPKLLSFCDIDHTLTGNNAGWRASHETKSKTKTCGKVSNKSLWITMSSEDRIENSTHISLMKGYMVAFDIALYSIYIYLHVYCKKWESNKTCCEVTISSQDWKSTPHHIT